MGRSPRLGQAGRGCREKGVHTWEKGVQRRQVGTAALALVCLSPVMSCAAGDACPPSLEVFPEVGVFVYEGLSDNGEVLRNGPGLGSQPCLHTGVTRRS